MVEQIVGQACFSKSGFRGGRLIRVHVVEADALWNSEGNLT